MGARRSCASIHFPQNAGSSSKYIPARPSHVGVLKKLMVESKNAHQDHTENTEGIRTKVLRLENELEFANRNLARLHSTVQLLATEIDRANSTVRELFDASTSGLEIL